MKIKEWSIESEIKEIESDDEWKKFKYGDKVLVNIVFER